MRNSVFHLKTQPFYEWVLLTRVFVCVSKFLDSNCSQALFLLFFFNSFFLAYIYVYYRLFMVIFFFCFSSKNRFIFHVGFLCLWMNAKSLLYIKYSQFSYMLQSFTLQLLFSQTQNKHSKRNDIMAFLVTNIRCLFE